MSVMSRNYTAKLVVNTGAVTVSSGMKVFNTDKDIFNITLELQRYDLATKKYITLESGDLTNNKEKLNIIKPKTNQILGVEGVLNNNRYEFNMPVNASDQIGSYRCQFVITNDEGTGEYADDEIVTSSSFAYTVVGSIATGLNPEINANPDTPILLELIERVENLNANAEFKFNVDGELEVTIGGVTKTFVPKA